MSAPRSPTDVRLLPGAVAAWLGCLVVTRAGTTSGLLLALASLLVAADGLRRLRRTSPARHRRRQHTRAAATSALAGLACAAVLLGATAQVDRREAQVAPHLGATGDVELRITSEPRPVEAWRPGAVRMTARWLAMRPSSGERTGLDVPVVVIATSWPDVMVGEVVGLRGRVSATGPGDAAAALVVAESEPVRLARAPPLARTVAGLRAGLLDATADMDPQARGLVPGIALGDDRRLPPALADDLRTTSLTHVTAVSGAHVALVVGLVLLGVLWLPRWPRALVAAAALAGMVVLVHPSASVVRAAAMGGVMLLGTALARPRAAMPALAVAVLLLLALDPWLAGSFGFALSVLATGGLLLGAGPLAHRLSQVLPRPLAIALAVPTAAQIAVVPVLMLLQPQLPVHGVLANVLAAPAVPPATILGLLATLLHPALPGVAEGVAGLAAIATAWIAAVATWCAALPLATAPWPVLLVPALVMVALLVRRARTHASGRTEAARRPG